MGGSADKHQAKHGKKKTSMTAASTATASKASHNKATNVSSQ